MDHSTNIDMRDATTTTDVPLETVASSRHSTSPRNDLKAQLSVVKNNDIELYDALCMWCELDRNPETQSALLTLLSDYPKNASTLKRQFCKRLTFNTAGLRACMGIGFNCMNFITVQQATQGLASYLFCKYGKERCAASGVVVGFDGRHKSKEFAHTAAAVFYVCGFKVYLNSKMSATPMNPYCVLQKKCLAGVQITASHNPKEYNGYKVYAANGAQIVSPMDAEIFNAILENLRMWNGVSDLLDRETHLIAPQHQEKVIDPYDEIFESYMQHTTKLLSTNKVVMQDSKLKIVYTAMHGVGWPFVAEILKRFGYNLRNLLVVESQKLADPEFSTLAFPNPEEKGAMDMALALADENSSPMVIANDPDADRFACAEKTNGQWRMFTGDEIGILLAHRCLKLAEKRGIEKDKMLFVCSMVSSRMLSKMCDVEGCQFQETLTGFKWMMNKALECESQGLSPVFVYEEALGYAVDIGVPDKDGISAAAVWVEFACELYESAKTVAHYLDELNHRYGYFVSNNSYVTCDSEDVMASIFSKFREGDYTWKIGDYAVKRIRDVAVGYDKAMPNNNNNKTCVAETSAAASPSISQILTLFFENGAVVTLRNSGTEPKLKWYSEMSASSPEIARAELQLVLNACIEKIINPIMKLSSSENATMT